MLRPFLSAIVLAYIVVGPPAALAAQQPPSDLQQQASQQPWPPAGVFRIGSAGVTAPILTKEVKPRYTSDSMDAKIEGTVVLEAIVESDGSVGEVRVKKSLDRKFGLDEEAMKVVKQWRFKPGKKDGVAVPVLIEVEMSFSLRK